MYRNVLCLCDSEEVLQSLQPALDCTFDLVPVNTVLSAIQQMRKCPPDLIVVQLHLKEESCFDFLKIAQSTVQENGIPMIAVSVREECDEAIESYLKKVCLYFGCRLYLTNNDLKSTALRFSLGQLVRKTVTGEANSVC